jgi:hypothetical protein
MPAKAGIHDFLGCDKGKSWIASVRQYNELGKTPMGQSSRRLALIGIRT